MSEEKDGENALPTPELPAETLVNLAPVGIFITDPQGNCTFANPQWCRLTGLPAAAALGDGWMRTLHEDDRREVLAAWRQTIVSGRDFAREYRCVGPDGSIVWVTARAIGTHDEHGRLTGYITTLVDVTDIKAEQRKMWLELQEANRRLSEIATTDSLTGIANHFAFRQRLEQVQLEAERGRPALLLFADVDHFKHFNDVHGHHAGDDVLRMVAKMIRQAVRKIDFVARYGGEEFVVILLDTTAEGALVVAERIRNSVAGLNHGYDLPVTISIGICQNPLGKRTIDEITRCADRALYLAKKNGRNRVEVGDC